QLAALTLGQTPQTRDLERLRQRRAELGLPAGDEDPLVLDPATGLAVAAEALPLHLRRARLTRVSLDANSGVCRGMLQHRYGTVDQRGDDE
ncbi:MAG: metal-sulfur cluster biosynthetic enzyme, partial [Geodermatophilaceae bacterium]|nr:metal-sulfur cluster biosynthetic enzyme [Geodermatophilaceae bacterium]